MTITEQGPISILVADHEAIFRCGLCVVLGASEHFRVLGVAEGAEEVCRKATRLQPDVLIIDLETCRQPSLLPCLIQGCPHTRLLAVGEASEAGALSRLLPVGAAALVPRSVGDEELRRTVEALWRGELFPAPAGFGPHPRGSRPLTAREQEVLRFITQGMSNKEVARALAISVRTVENHRASIMKKLALRSVVDLVKYAISSGLATCK